jgi:hypothetical protein
MAAPAHKWQSNFVSNQSVVYEEIQLHIAQLENCGSQGFVVDTFCSGHSSTSERVHEIVIAKYVVAVLRNQSGIQAQNLKYRKVAFMIF